jgi:hypothetical protein
VRIPFNPKLLRDSQKYAITRELKQHEWFSQVPTQVLGSLAEMLAISRDLRAKIKRESVMRPDGTVHPAVEAFRKYKHTELGYLTAIAEMRKAEHEEQRDLAAEMARRRARAERGIRGLSAFHKRSFMRRNFPVPTANSRRRYS